MRPERASKRSGGAQPQCYGLNDLGRATASTGGSRGSHFRRALGGKARADKIYRTRTLDTVLSNAARNPEKLLALTDHQVSSRCTSTSASNSNRANSCADSGRANRYP